MKKNLRIIDFIYLFNFIFPNVAFLIIPSPNSTISSLTLIGKILVFIFYLAPTFLFIGYIIKNKISFNEFRISNFKFKDLKGVRSNCMFFLLSIIEGVYLLLNGFWYVGIPTIFMAIELILCVIFDFKINREKQLKLDIMFQEQRISLKDLERYDKWKGFYSSIFATLIVSILIMIPLLYPLTYLNLLPNTIYPYLIFCILFIYIFIDRMPYPQMLDCKNNSFIKAKGICIGYEQPGKGTGGHHIVKIVGIDMRVSIPTEKRIYTNKQVVTVIFGLHSEQVIGFY